MKKENRKRVAGLEGVVVLDRLIRKGLLETSYIRPKMGSSLVVSPVVIQNPYRCAGKVQVLKSMVSAFWCSWAMFVTSAS